MHYELFRGKMSFTAAVMYEIDVFYVVTCVILSKDPIPKFVDDLVLFESIA